MLYFKPSHTHENTWSSLGFQRFIKIFLLIFNWASPVEPRNALIRFIQICSYAFRVLEVHFNLEKAGLTLIWSLQKNIVQMCLEYKGLWSYLGCA